MAESSVANTVAVFVLQKLGKKNPSCFNGVFFIQLSTKPNDWAIDFHEWQIKRKVKVPVLDAGGTFKDYGDM